MSTDCFHADRIESTWWMEGWKKASEKRVEIKNGRGCAHQLVRKSERDCFQEDWIVLSWGANSGKKRGGGTVERGGKSKRARGCAARESDGESKLMTEWRRRLALEFERRRHLERWDWSR